MKKALILVLIMTFILGSISFAEETDLLDSYQANQTYRYDLDGDGKIDNIYYVCDGESTPTFFINQNMYTLTQSIPELYLAKFKIVDIDKSDKYSEIAVSYASPPDDNIITFYRYTSSGLDIVDEKSVKFEDIGKNSEISSNQSNNQTNSKSNNKANNQNSEAQLQTYEEVYQVKGLKGTIDYFDANYNRFKEEERGIFAAMICREVYNRSDEYYAVTGIKPEETPAPPNLDNVNYLYPGIYDGETNKLNISTLDEGLQAVISKIDEDDVFQVVKAYYVMEDVFEDSGFRVAFRPEVYEKLERAFDLMFIKKDGRYRGQEGEPIEAINMIAKPDEIVSASDTSWSSDATYPEVYVETVDKLQLLKGAWKTNAYLPVNITESNQVSQLSTYDEVFKQEGLLACINYFDRNYDKFNSEARMEFASRISWEIANRVNRYFSANTIEVASTPAKPTLNNVNYLYPGIYDGDTNTLKPDKLDNEIRQAVLKTALDPVFMITKAYYITDGYIEDNGFKLTIHPEIFNKIKRALDLTFTYKDGTYFAPDYGEVFGIQQLSMPEEVVKVNDNSWNPDKASTEILVEDIGKLELMKDAWKTNVYIPVYIEGFGTDRETSNLKSFEEVSRDGGLMACINYFDANYNKFSDKARYTFAEQISLLVFDKINEYHIYNSSYPENVYDKDTNIFNLKAVSDSEIKERLKTLKNDDVFMLTQSYWIEDGFSDSGFKLAIHPDTVKKLRRAIDLACSTDNYGNYIIKGGSRIDGHLDWVAMPDELVTASDSSWSSEKTYPLVLVEEPEQLKLLEGAWKVVVYIPVKIQEDGSEVGTADSASRLSAYTAEDINGTKINYADYTTVIVPMYDGVNKDALDVKTLLIGSKYTSVVTLAVFGEISNLKVLHTNNGMNEEYKETKVGDLKNTIIIINTEFPTDFANILIKAYARTGSGEYENIEFTMDDMRDPAAYKPILVK